MTDAQYTGQRTGCWAVQRQNLLQQRPVVTLDTMTSGIIIAATHSDAGKTTVTLALLRALSAQLRVGAFKVGPDYIDPRFHAAAARTPVYNLDPWAMDDHSLAATAALHADKAFCVTEGVMGLFDGAADGRGSTAEFARRSGWPVVLVVDCKGQSDSVAALVSGFRDFDPEVGIKGVILNRVGSDNHDARLRRALAAIGMPVLGSLRRLEQLALPKRHLGLLQASEISALDAHLDAAAKCVLSGLDLERLTALAQPCALNVSATTSLWVPNFGPRLALAEDTAFAFCYPHWRARWAEAGVTVMPFSPLADEPPPPDATGVFLPGGYPELHADTLAQANYFKAGLRSLADARVPVYGECGGFMVLGKTITDANGDAHSMCDLLPIATDFSSPRLHLGYRRLRGNLPAALSARALNAHEFHYSKLTQGDGVAPSVSAVDALGAPIDSAMHARGSVFGSYIHAIDRAGD